MVPGDGRFYRRPMPIAFDDYLSHRVLSGRCVRSDFLVSVDLETHRVLLRLSASRLASIDCGELV